MVDSFNSWFPNLALTLMLMGVKVVSLLIGKESNLYFN
jgi:hypothetical protein